MEKKEAVAKINELLEKVDALLKEAAEIAYKENVPFSWDGPAYGMGGYYDPIPVEDGEDPDEWESSGGWQASSQSC